MQKYFLLLLIFLFASCAEHSQDAGKITVFSDIAMTIRYKILIGGPFSPEDNKTVIAVIKSTFHEIDEVYNIWNPRSELSLINAGPAETPLHISPELENLLFLTDKLVKTTKGLYDPTIVPAYKMWKEALEKNTMPDPDRLALLKEFVGWKHIHLHPGFLVKDHRELQIDLGGIAKGFCVDLLTERLNASGFPNIYVEWGGEIRTSGKHPEGRPWKIYIGNPENPSREKAIDTLSLHNAALATSGDYLQQWKIQLPSSGETVVYSHIIHPYSLIPIIAGKSNICSATVLGDNCAVADALATAVMLLADIKEAEAWIPEVQKEYPGTDFWLVQREKSGETAK